MKYYFLKKSIFLNFAHGRVCDFLKIFWRFPPLNDKNSPITFKHFFLDSLLEKSGTKICRKIDIGIMGGATIFLKTPPKMMKMAVGPPMSVTSILNIFLKILQLKYYFLKNRKFYCLLFFAIWLILSYFIFSMIFCYKGHHEPIKWII